MENVIHGKFRKLKLIKNENPDSVIDKEFQRLELFLLQENQDDESIKTSIKLLRSSYFWWQNKE